MGKHVPSLSRIETKSILDAQRMEVLVHLILGVLQILILGLVLGTHLNQLVTSLIYSPHRTTISVGELYKTI